MSLQLLLKCSVSVFIVTFWLCPKGIQSLASIGKQQDYYRAIRKPGRADLSQRRADLTKLKMLNLRDETHGKHFLQYFDLSVNEIKKLKLWTDGIVPYFIDPVSFNDKFLRDQIRAILFGLSNRAAVTFQELPVPPKDESTRWVFFANRRGQLGCSDHSSMNFTNSGIQLVHMGYDCLREDLREALLLLLGVPAQHNAPNRDDYITVIEKNIIPEKRYLYEKVNDSQWLFHNLNYDYASVTHFDTHRNTVNGYATIRAKDSDHDGTIGQTSSYSEIDLAKIRLLYNYIVAEKSKKIPECNKIFKKSPNYYKPLDGGDRAWLRPKLRPIKYLGINEPDLYERDDYEVLDTDWSPLDDKGKMRGINKKKAKNINLQFYSDYISS